MGDSKRRQTFDPNFGKTVISDAQLDKIARAIYHVRDNELAELGVRSHQSCFFVSYMGVRLIGRQDYGLSAANICLRTSMEVDSPAFGLNSDQREEDFHCVITRAAGSGNSNEMTPEIIDFNVGAIYRACISQGARVSIEYPEWLRVFHELRHTYPVSYSNPSLESEKARSQKIHQDDSIKIAEMLAKRAVAVLRDL
jgi:hypothetical protein